MIQLVINYAIRQNTAVDYNGIDHYIPVFYKSGLPACQNKLEYREPTVMNYIVVGIYRV